MEIYNESLRDLLRPRGSADVPLAIHQNAQVGVYVQGLTDNPVFSSDDVQHLINFGMKARSVGAHAMNPESSRSHCIFTLEVRQTLENVNGGKSSIRSRINLVDLAGSERQKKTQATGNRLKEGSMINQSLSSLAMVINKLAANRRGEFVPFRNSKLTFALQDSLAGNSRTVMVAALSPAASNAEETLSTLRFAESVKCIKTRARKNEEKDDVLVALKAECERLKREIASGSSQSASEELERAQELMSKYGANIEDQLRLAQHQRDMRASALADMGLSVKEMAECLGLDKATPVLVNAFGDPSLNANLVNVLQQIVTIGSSNECQMVLKGEGIAEKTAKIENIENQKLVLTSLAGRVVVNGVAIAIGNTTILRHGDRLAIGCSHDFRVVLPAATSDLEYHDWSRQHLAELLRDALRDEHRFNQCLRYIDQMEGRLGATRTQRFIQRLGKATRLADEANAISARLLPLDRLVFAVETSETLFGDDCSVPECVIRVSKGETGAARWRNVTRRHLMPKYQRKGFAMTLAEELPSLGPVPQPFRTVAVLTTVTLREQLLVSQRSEARLEVPRAWVAWVELRSGFSCPASPLRSRRSIADPGAVASSMPLRALERGKSPPPPSSGEAATAAAVAAAQPRGGPPGFACSAAAAAAAAAALAPPSITWSLALAGGRERRVRSPSCERRYLAQAQSEELGPTAAAAHGAARPRGGGHAVAVSRWDSPAVKYRSISPMPGRKTVTRQAVSMHALPVAAGISSRMPSPALSLSYQSPAHSAPFVRHSLPASLKPVVQTGHASTSSSVAAAPVMRVVAAASASGDAGVTVVPAPKALATVSASAVTATRVLAAPDGDSRESQLANQLLNSLRDLRRDLQSHEAHVDALRTASGLLTVAG
eukprot:TRINITY_DN28714_c0_g1_i1.p1 TRINITY_DN28714_c0_g1~~TRINITY_DN28714_c0_g1_i1.p1  ORF type:complete len:1037 (+),score=227.18 TRINITY_DN28714_c0_g1_i1:450-3113(+)